MVKSTSIRLWFAQHIVDRPERVAVLLAVLAFAAHCGYFYLDRAAWQDHPVDGRTHRVVMTLFESGGAELWTPCEPCGDGRIAFAPPFFTLYLAAFYLALGPTWVASAVALSAAALWFTWLTFRVAHHLFGLSTATLAGLGVALYPYYLTQYRPHYETLFFAALTLASSWSLLRFRSSGERRWAAIGGLWLGLAALCRPDPICWLPFIGIWLVTVTPGGWRPKAASAARYVGAFLVVLLPWTARNYVVDGVLSPFGTFAGMNRYKAYHPLLREYYLGIGPFTETAARKLGSDHVIAIGPEWDRSQVAEMPPEAAQAWREAMPLGYWVEHPLEFAQLEVLKVVKTWSWEPEPIRYSDTHRVIYILSYLPVLLLGLGGCWVSRGRWRDTSLFAALAVGVTACAALTYGVTRYRLAIDVYLIILAAESVRVGFERIGGQRRSARETQ